MFQHDSMTSEGRTGIVRIEDVEEGAMEQFLQVRRGS